MSSQLSGDDNRDYFCYAHAQNRKILQEAVLEDVMCGEDENDNYDGQKPLVSVCFAWGVR
jgi:hypothetical protein